MNNVEVTSEIIIQSLELVAEACEDPTPFVYKRLFAKHPEMEALFVLDKNDSAKGHMQFEAIECILDLLGPRIYATTLIQSERINHDGIGVSQEIFQSFFPTLKETFQELVGEDWTPEIEGAWTTLLAELENIIEAS